MANFLVEIITPERQAFAQEVDAVSVPTHRGTIGVLAHHAPLFTALSEGEIKLTAGNKEYFIAIGGGFMEVAKQRVSILVSRAVHAHELNESEIKRAQESAKEVIKRRVKGAEFIAAQSILRRSFVEMKVLKRRRTIPPPLVSSVGQ